MTVRRAPLRAPRRIAGALAVAAALALVGSACTGDDGVEVVIDDGVDGDEAAMDLARDNAYAAASRSLEGTPYDGLMLEVEYFEPLRKGEWVAPDRCTFSTRVTVNGALASPGFDGPRSDDDRDAGDGVLVATTDTFVTGPVGPPTPPTTTTEVTDPAPDPGPTTTAGGGATTTSRVDPTRPTLAPQAPPSREPAPGDSVGGAPMVTTTEDPSAAPGTAPPLPPDVRPAGEQPIDVDPGMLSQQPATVALAAVFGHDQVVELSTEHPAVLEGHSLEAQPLDGWNVLRVALDPAAELGEAVPVTLRRLHEDGTETDEQIDVPVGGSELELLTEDWRFDLAGVDEGCAVPEGSTDNQPAAPDVDVFGSPVGDAPELPQPGTPPADPAAAADEALRSLRIVYDLADIWSESKRDHMENPEDYDIMRRELLANDVVAPYMSNLDPEFRSSVFVSPTEAHILYRVGPSYQWSIGRVLLIDGDWRVAAGTLCRDLSAAGYRCPNTVNDPPPGPLGGY